MVRIRTLRFRFALWVAGLLLAVFAALGAFVYVSQAQGLASSLDAALELGASQAIAAVNVEDGQLSFSDSVPNSENATTDLRDRGVTIRILDPGGRVVQAFGTYRDLPIPAGSLAAALSRQATFATVPFPPERAPVRFYTTPIVEEGQLVGVVQVALSLASVQETLGRLLITLLIGGPLLIGAAAFGGYFLAARALAPIDTITRTARRISAEDLSARLNLPATDDEVGRLAATLDEMLARLDESFRRERQFTADASHELRTPLAAMQAILGVVRERRRTPEDYEQALVDLSEEADRLRGLVEDLLRLARGDAQQRAAREPLDLSTLLGDVTDSLRPLAEARGLALTYTGPAGLVLSGDADGLIRLFVNLLDNAIQYTERGAVTVTAGTAAGAVQVAVADTGGGIPPEHLPRNFDRFYRQDSARSSRGAGLGLAIALDIARAHGGTITVESTVGVGSTFTVHLPL
jgi:heavy metal sensor kinase